MRTNGRDREVLVVREDRRDRFPTYHCPANWSVPLKVFMEADSASVQLCAEGARRLPEAALADEQGDLPTSHVDAAQLVDRQGPEGRVPIPRRGDPDHAVGDGLKPAITGRTAHRDEVHRGVVDQVPLERFHQAPRGDVVFIFECVDGIDGHERPAGRMIAEVRIDNLVRGLNLRKVQWNRRVAARLLDVPDETMELRPIRKPETRAAVRTSDFDGPRPRLDIDGQAARRTLRRPRGLRMNDERLLYLEIRGERGELVAQGGDRGARMDVVGHERVAGRAGRRARQ